MQTGPPMRSGWHGGTGPSALGRRQPAISVRFVAVNPATPTSPSGRSEPLASEP